MRAQPGNRIVSFVRGAARREIICPLGLFAPPTVAVPPAVVPAACPVARWLGSLAWLLAFGFWLFAFRFSLFAFGFSLLACVSSSLARWLGSAPPLLARWLAGLCVFVLLPVLLRFWLVGLVARWLVGSLARWLVVSLACCLLARSLVRSLAKFAPKCILKCLLNLFLNLFLNLG